MHEASAVAGSVRRRRAPVTVFAQLALSRVVGFAHYGPLA
jgi:hypothetical protein